MQPIFATYAARTKCFQCGPRRLALEVSGASIILVHNHTTEFSNPSKEDIKVTKRIQKVGSEMGIPLLDHVIISRGYYVSCLHADTSPYEFPDHL